MTAAPQLRVLFFDVFGTCVAQTTSVADELWKAAQEALTSSGTPLSDDVRTKAMQMTHGEWSEFGMQWNAEADKFVHESIAQRDSVDWKAADKYRIALLPILLARKGIVIVDNDPDMLSTSIRTGTPPEPQVMPGSLWNQSQLNHLGHIWHRLEPWPDTCRGLIMLNQQFSTAALSNTYNDLLQSLVAHGSIPFTHTYCSEMFNSYKPSPKVYLGAAERMGVKPEQCALVAAHLSDLKGAKACGFYTIYVKRPTEEKNPGLSVENIPEMIVEADEDGFIALARRLEMGFV